MMLTGFAEIVMVGGGISVTVTVAVVVPAGPVAVMMYVVVCVGEIDRVPPVGTVPIP